MGGKLFQLPRMPRAQYLEIEADVRRYLDDKMPGRYRIPRYYGDKPDFGDMDVILAKPHDYDKSPDKWADEWDALRAAILRDFYITEYKSVGHIFSTSLRGLQTDFFMVPEEDLETTYTFMSFNDLGNFIGRICRRFDLKYGERGLEYVYRRAAGNHHVNLEVSRDFKEICNFLGLDYDAFQQGFGSLREVFDWVTTSPYFSVAPYLDETSSNLRKRAADRTTVTRFIAYLRECNVDKRPEFRERGSYLADVIAAFPRADLGTKIQRERDAEARSIVIAEKFNGKRVMRLLPSFEGEKLGALIRQFKASINDFEGWVLHTDEAEIDARIVAFAASFEFIST
jgi:hypothetical protein